MIEAGGLYPTEGFDGLRDAAIFYPPAGSTPDPSETYVVKPPRTKDEWSNPLSLLYFLDYVGIPLDPRNDMFVLLRGAYNLYVTDYVANAKV